MSKKASLFLCFLALSLFVLVSCGRKNRWQTSTLFYFDTIIEVRLLCGPQELERADQAVSALFSEVEALFSPQKEDLSSPLVLELHSRAEKIYQDTSGCFDITVEPLSLLWGFREKTYRIPKDEDIRSVLPLIGMSRIKKEGARLVLQPGMMLDWGGIAKGYSVDMAASCLIEMGFERGYINAGGDLFCWGDNPFSGAWRIGIKHPRTQGFIGILSLSGAAAATTGDYIRYFEQDGRRYHHIFNPGTGYPAKGKQSVTVIGPETLVCDALATALFVCPDPEDILSRYPQYGAIIVLDSGETQVLGKKFAFDPV